MPRIYMIALDPTSLGEAARNKHTLRRELAADSGVSESTLRRAFAGQPIGVDTARSIAAALGVSLDSIVVRSGRVGEVAPASTSAGAA